jgi:diguanylate cyclase (GGDEF)-like protein
VIVMPSGTACYAVLDHVPLGVLVLDREMRVVFWNRCLEDWTSVRREELLDTDIRLRFPRLGDRRYVARLHDLLAGGAPTVFSSQLHPNFIPAPLRSGRLRVQHTVAVAVPTESGEHHALLAVQDVTSLADAMSALRHARDAANVQAATDSLTGVSNRRHFVEESERIVALAHRHGRPCSVLLVDLDSFKGVNDTWGHAAGDALLRNVVAVCRRALRDSDVLGRIGGDEFAALLPETSAEMAVATAERLRLAVAEAGVPYEGRELHGAVSIGVAGLGDRVVTVDDLLRQADTALYQAKNAGRNRVVLA